MIINVAHIKGGVGKTTVATNLAVGLNADLMDLDVLGASILFGNYRKRFGKNLTVFGEHDLSIKEAFSKYRGSKQHHLVVDSGGYDSDNIRMFLASSDMIITPLAASGLEINGIRKFDETVISQLPDNGVKVYALLNRVTQFDKKDDAVVLCNFISANLPDYKILKTHLGDRRVYKQAYISGQSVIEMGASKAADEIESLIQEIKVILKIGE